LRSLPNRCDHASWIGAKPEEALERIGLIEKFDLDQVRQIERPETRKMVGDHGGNHRAQFSRRALVVFFEAEFAIPPAANREAMHRRFTLPSDYFVERRSDRHT
jgi:hypothetical protein